jgi:hypothetical protein
VDGSAAGTIDGAVAGMAPVEVRGTPGSGAGINGIPVAGTSSAELSAATLVASTSRGAPRPPSPDRKDMGQVWVGKPG